MNILDFIDVELKSKSKTHFAIFNGKQIKYLIDVNDKNYYNNLIKNQSSYSINHRIFKYLIKLLPNILSILPSKVKGCNVKINKDLKSCLNNNINDKVIGYNYIIGTEGKHQKIVVQAVCEDKNIYIKMGNNNTKELIINESKVYKILNNLDLCFITPTLLFEHSENGININALSEVKGNEVTTQFNEDILRLYKEISNIKYDLNQKNEIIELEFSHGDFAPWNIKKYNDKFIVYDWEYAKMRFKGYDVIHYIFQVQYLLNKLPMEEALDKAITNAKKYVTYLERLDNSYIKNLYLDERKITYLE